MRAVVHQLACEGRETSPPLSTRAVHQGMQAGAREATTPHFPDSWLQQRAADHRDSRPYPASSFPSEVLV